MYPVSEFLAALEKVREVTALQIGAVEWLQGIQARHDEELVDERALRRALGYTCVDTEMSQLFGADDYCSICQGSLGYDATALPGGC